MAKEHADQKALQKRYGKGYFHGVNSGYPEEGYPAGRQDWAPWLDFLHSLQPQGILADLGCAYGYLPAQARRMGYRAFGLDVSAFALSQEPEFRPFLCQAHLGRLPLPDNSADLVCLFDVLEHLEDPSAALREAARILKPEGLLAGATPDPIFFEGNEPTHCFERPPSFWIAALESLGLRTQFRFSVEAYNFQFLAAFPGPANEARLARLQHDYFSGDPDIVEACGPLKALPRFGFAARSGRGRLIREPRAAVYLLNRLPTPLRIRARIELQAESCSMLRILWNSQVVAELFPGAAPLQGTYPVEDFLLPSGGHHLFFEPVPAGAPVEVLHLELEAADAKPQDLTQTLPFDLYQRYRLAADLARQLQPRSILDWGGVLGDRDGHLATPRDFLGPTLGGKLPAEVASTDVRHCDHPCHIPIGQDEGLPQDRTFDLVLSLDVLEHLPAKQRPRLLRRLDRLAERWVILGAPFADPAVEAAEAQLRGGLMGTRQFLQEHRQFGLPQRESILEYFAEERGYQVAAFPSGWLPRWIECQALTQHYFSLDDYPAATLFNRLCNRHFYRSDLREPAYRTLFLICKQPLPPGLLSGMRRRLAAPAQPDVTSQASFSGDPDFLRLHERILQLQEKRRTAHRDACFLLHEREKHIALLQKTVEDLQALNRAPLYRIALRRARGEK